jgi:hypothetical protein
VCPALRAPAVLAVLSIPAHSGGLVSQAKSLPRSPFSLLKASFTL